MKESASRAVMERTSGARLLWQKGMGKVNTYVAAQMQTVAEIIDEEEGFGKWLAETSKKKKDTAARNKARAEEIAAEEKKRNDERRAKEMLVTVQN